VEFIATHWRLAAVAALVFAGFAARRAGWASAANGRWLLTLVYNVGLPVLIFGALTGVPLAREHVLLPLTAVGTMLIGWGAAVIVARRFELPPVGTGALALCAMSINMSMVYPFASLRFSPDLFAQLVMFDMGHAVMVWTLSTVVACRYGGHTGDIPVLLKRALLAPALWVLALALALNLSGAPVPRRLIDTSLIVGQGIVLLVPFAMGLLVSGHGLRRPEVSIAVVLRTGLGALAGFALGLAFGFEGSTAHLAIIAAAAPIGFTAVVLSAREGLDLDLTASAASISVFLGSLWIPVAIGFV
jgi:predicted permease